MSWKKVAYFAAEQAYQSEVVQTLMEESIIGENGYFADKQDWINQRVAEWIEEAIGVDEEMKK